MAVTWMHQVPLGNNLVEVLWDKSYSQLYCVYWNILDYHDSSLNLTEITKDNE